MWAKTVDHHCSKLPSVVSLTKALKLTVGFSLFDAICCSCPNICSLQDSSPEQPQTSGVKAEWKKKKDYGNSIAQNLERHENVGGESSERKWDLNVPLKPEQLVPSKQALVVITTNLINLWRLPCTQLSKTSEIKKQDGRLSSSIRDDHRTMKTLKSQGREYTTLVQI